MEEILQALKDSNIELIVGVPNDNLQALASPSAAAANWVQVNIKCYFSNVKFKYIAVGNEVKPNDPAAKFVLPEMPNVHKEIASAESNTTANLFLMPYLPRQEWSLVRKYRNLFDALIDAMYSAMEKTNGGNLVVVVSESGWPSAGGQVETVEHAATYYRNLINHVKGSGTPKRPSMPNTETYLFSMFDENKKGLGD
ncbi:hypothetical protein FNV43_RR02932 [Rhamnella rubrinervis]|uniref:glucan endo-1,3-beta-D-glucosidase n=1 Tax=Rhamnella rubrinervis TaxID=2594499 RepID=A0A8K0HHX3_9ROSA|nr:hypothetical protein FNV43_RR02932 [Rhamnella rubrinervis]